MAEKTTILKIVVSGFGEASRDLEFLTTETAKLGAEKKKMTAESTAAARAITAEEGSIEKLRAQTALLRQEANNMRAVTEKEIQTRTQLTKQIADNTTKIREHDRAMSGSSTLVGEYEKGFGEAFRGIGVAATALGGVIVGIYGTFKAFTEILKSTATTADALEATIEGVKQGFDAIKRSVATLDFKDFMKNVKAAYEEGRRYAEGLDSIDEKTRALQAAEAEANIEYMNQRVIQNDSTKSLEEKIKAGKRAIEIEDRLAGIRTGIAKQAFKNEIDNISQITRLTNDEVLAFMKMDDAMVANIESGKLYNEAQEKLAKYYGGAITLSEQEYKKLTASINSATEETRRFAFAQANMPDDEKMQLLTDRYVGFQNAIVFSIEKTLRVKSKQSSAEKKLSDEQAKTLQDTLKDKELMEKYTDEYFKKEEARNQKSLSDREIMEKYADEYFKRELKRNQDSLKEKELMEQYTNDYFEKEIKRKHFLTSIEEEHQNSRIRIATSAADVLNVVAGKNKALQSASLIADKALAIAEVIIQTRKANAATMAWGALAGPPGIAAAFVANQVNNVSMGVSIAAIIAATAIGLAGINQKAQKFASGGRIFGGVRVTPDSRGDDTLIVAKQGEAILNESQQRRIGLSNLKRAGVPGFADGGLIGGLSYSPGLPFDVETFVNRMINGINDKQVILNVNKVNSAIAESNFINQSNKI